MTVRFPTCYGRSLPAVLVLVLAVRAAPRAVLSGEAGARPRAASRPAPGVDITTRLYHAPAGRSAGPAVHRRQSPRRRRQHRRRAGGRAAAGRLHAALRLGALVMSQTLYKKLRFNLERDFEPIGDAGLGAVHPGGAPVAAGEVVKEFVALAKSRPGQMSFASTGNGSTPHLSMEMFEVQAGINLVHVPYKGTPQAVTDLLSGPGARDVRQHAVGAAAGQGGPAARARRSAARSAAPPRPSCRPRRVRHARLRVGHLVRAARARRHAARSDRRG